MLSLPVGLTLLLIVSIVFDRVIRAFDRANPDHPFVSLFVVVGVLYTLLIVYMIDGFAVSEAACTSAGWLRWDTTIMAFVVSGLPMIIGNIGRWSQRR